jgi:hypothetical protein
MWRLYRLFSMVRFVQPSAYEPIGFVRKIKGIKGMMIIQLDHPTIPWQPSCLFFYRYQTYVPYLVDLWTQEGTSATLLLKSIVDRTEAQTFRLLPVFLSIDDFNAGLVASSSPLNA